MAARHLIRYSALAMVVALPVSLFLPNSARGDVVATIAPLTPISRMYLQNLNDPTSAMIPGFDVLENTSPTIFFTISNNSTAGESFTITSVVAVGTPDFQGGDQNDRLVSATPSVPPNQQPLPPPNPTTGVSSTTMSVALVTADGPPPISDLKPGLWQVDLNVFYTTSAGAKSFEIEFFDVNVTDVPEPSPLVLGLSGLSLIGVVHRLRQRLTA